MKSRRKSIGSTSSGGWGCLPVGERRTKQRRKMSKRKIEERGQEKNEERGARNVDEQKQKQQMSQSRC